MKKPVIYIPVKYRDKMRLDFFPSAGPRPNVAGMRRIYGENAFLVMCGSYLYNVPESIYQRAFYKQYDY